MRGPALALLALTLLAGCRSDTVGDGGAPVPFQAVLDDPDAAPYRPDPGVRGPGVLIDGQRFHSLAAALLAARDGDALHLEGGQHRGPLEIDRRVALFPADSGEAVTILSTASHVVRVGSAGDALLRGLTLRALGAHTPGAEGAVVLLGGRLTLEDCLVAAPDNAALFQAGGELTVTRGGLTTERWSQAAHVERGGLARFHEVAVVAVDEQASALVVDGSQVELVGGSLEASRSCLELLPGARVTASLVRLTGGGLVVGVDSRLVMTDSELLGSHRGAITCAGDARLVRCRLIDHPLAARVQGRHASLQLEHVTSVNISRPILLENGALQSQVTLVATEFAPSDPRR